jgi:hypothetical protein
VIYSNELFAESLKRDREADVSLPAGVKREG